MLVERWRLQPGERWREDTDGEMVIHPLVGIGKVEGIKIGGRKNVFDAFPGGATAPAGTEIEAVTYLDVIIITHPNDEWPLLAPTKAKVHMLGKGCWKREVREVVGSDEPTIAIRCGETVNRPGGWSSWPPHHFDKEKLTGFQEVFYVFTDPKESYGIIRINGSLKEVRSGERLEIPLGEHPIVAAPNTRLMYFWAYVGADKIYPRFAEDVGQYK